MIGNVNFATEEGRCAYDETLNRAMDEVEARRVAGEVGRPWIPSRSLLDDAALGPIIRENG